MTTSATANEVLPRQPTGRSIVGAIIAVVLVAAVVVFALENNNWLVTWTCRAFHSRGRQTAVSCLATRTPITIVEFADFAARTASSTTGYCGFIQDLSLPAGEIRDHFPDGGADRQRSTGSLECAENQKPVVLEGYNRCSATFSGLYNNDVGRRFATDLGLNYSDLLTCASSDTGADRREFRVTVRDY